MDNEEEIGELVTYQGELCVISGYSEYVGHRLVIDLHGNCHDVHEKDLNKKIYKH